MMKYVICIMLVCGLCGACTLADWHEFHAEHVEYLENATLPERAYFMGPCHNWQVDDGRWLVVDDGAIDLGRLSVVCGEGVA